MPPPKLTAIVIDALTRLPLRDRVVYWIAGVLSVFVVAGAATLMWVGFTDIRALQDEHLRMHSDLEAMQRRVDVVERVLTQRVTDLEVRVEQFHAGK
jgi:hypothetical protein